MSELLEDKRKKSPRRFFKPSANKCFCVLTFPLLIAATGFSAFFLAGIIQFQDELQGPLYGVLVSGLVVNALLLFTTCFGCLGFYNRDFTTLLLQVVIFMFLLTFHTIAGVIFAVGANQLESTEGFVKIVEDIELSFEQQVFNDCCIIEFNNGGAPEVPGPDQFSLGDIVNQDLCLLLQENSDETFVGNPLVDAELCNLLFADFQADFRTFTQKYAKILSGITWATIGIILLNVLFTFYQLCCGTRKKSEKGAPPENHESFGAPLPPPPGPTFTVPPTFGLSNQQKQGVSNFMSRLSSRGSSSQDRSGAPSMPAPGFFQGVRKSVSNAFNFGSRNPQESSAYTGVGPPLPRKNDYGATFAEKDVGNFRPPARTPKTNLPSPPSRPEMPDFGGSSNDPSAFDEDW